MKVPVTHYLIPAFWLAVLYGLFVYFSTQVATADKNSAFSARQAHQLYQQLVPADIPRPSGSQANLTAVAKVQQFLTEQGFETQLQQDLSCDQQTLRCANISNIVARKPGRISDDYVLLVSHHDTVPASPGSADPGAGMAILMAIAELDLTADRGLMLLFSDGEEIGLLGAKAFIDKHPWADKVSSVINLEARGTSGRSMLFETGKANNAMVNAISESLKSPLASSFFTGVYDFMPNQTDFTLFRNKGYSGANFAFIGSGEHYHTPGDNQHNLDMASLQHQGESALSLLTHLLASPDAPDDSSVEVFTDVFSQWLVSWPEDMTSLLVFLLLILISAYILHLERSKQFEFQAFINNMLVWLGVMLLAVLLGWLMTLAPPDAENRHLLLLLTLLLAVFASSYFHHAKDTGLIMLVPWIGWLLITMLIMLMSPALSAPFLLPLLLLFGFLLLGLLIKPLRRWLPALMMLASLFGLASMWRMGMQIEMAIGYRYPAIQLAVWVLGAMGCMALLCRYQSALLRWVSAALSAIIVVVVMVDRPPVPANMVNYIYLIDSQQKAHIVAVGDTEITNRETANHALFQSAPTEYFPWSPGYQSHGMAVPEHVATKNDLKFALTEGQYQVLVPGRADSQAIMLIIKGRQPEEVSINDVRLRMATDKAVNVVQLYNAAPSGTQISFSLPDMAHSDVYLVRKSWGLKNNQLSLPRAGLTPFSEGDMTMDIRQLEGLKEPK